MLKKHVYSFQNALSGLKWIARTQINFKIHLFFSLLALVFGFLLEISQTEFLIILTVIGTGLALEAVNTAIEEAIDAIHKDWSDAIKIAKDVSAGAMLIFAITAFVVACLIFLPKILLLFAL